MSSTRPIISVEALGRAAAALALAALACALVVAKGRDLWGGYAVAYAQDALNSAQRLGRGPDRDRALEKAQGYVRDGLRVAPGDPRLWNLLAETRLQQATEGGVAALSPTLLAASADASAHAAQLAPGDGAPQARLAYARSLQADAADAAAALKRSYGLTPSSPAYGHRRIEAAGRAWRAMDENLRRDVVGEACMLSARSTKDRDRLYALRMGYADPGLALALDEVLADPGCQPGA